MKFLSLIFNIFRSLLTYFGLGTGNCMYYPTCSKVISESFENQGFLKSIPVIIQRIYICNPIYKKVGKNWQY